MLSLPAAGGRNRSGLPPAAPLRARMGNPSRPVPKSRAVLQRSRLDLSPEMYLASTP